MRPLALIALSAGCALSSHPEVIAQPAPPNPPSWSEVLARPGVIEHEAVNSANIPVDVSGLVNLKHPAAAELEDRKVPMVMSVHVLRHPDRGVFLIDTGVHRGQLSGERGIIRWPLSTLLSDIEEVESLADIIARQPAPLAGVLITHMHPDHVMGLPDVPPGVPIHVGAGEQSTKALENVALRGTYGRLLEGHAPLTVFNHAPAPAPIEAATDLIGDGSLWALHTPGHTPGSTAYLALTTDGPTLFTGDTCHTWWGWEHDVEPGTFTLDHAQNAVSLAALRTLARTYDLRVFVGHELDGTGTGLDEPSAP